MRGLHSKLNDWIQAGILTPTQAKRIQELESSRSGTNWSMRLLLLLGVLVVATGLVSVIAANWAAIPDYLKLAVDFVILFSTSFLLYRWHRQEKPGLLEAGIFFFYLFLLASIGLISQVYHLSGKFYEATLFLSLISITLPFLSVRRFFPYLWSSVFFVSFLLVLKNVSFGEINFFIKDNWLGVVLLAPGLATVLTFLCSLFSSTKILSQAFQFWIFLSGLGAATIADTRISVEFLAKSLDTVVLYPGYVALLVGVALSFFRLDYSWGRKSLMALMALVLTLMYLPALLALSESYWGGALFVLLSALSALHFGSLGRMKIFNTLIFVIAIRFLVFYFQAIGGLMATGLGLLLSGAVILIGVYFWNKNQKQIHSWMKGLLA